MSAARRGLAGNAAVMFAGTATSRVLGLARNAVLALVLTVNVAGAANAFSVANKMPNVIYSLVAGGVLNAILVPQIVRAMRSEDGGKEYVDRLLTISAAALAALTLVLTAGAGLLVSLYGRQLGEWFPLAVAFAYWSIPQLFFYGLYTLLGQVLNARSIFGPFMWAPAVNNVVAIAGLGVFIALYGTSATNGAADVETWTPDRIALLAGTATLGVASQALILLLPLRRAGFRWRPRWGVRGSGLGTASRVAMWAFGALAVGQLGYLAVSNVAAAAATAGQGAAEVAGNAAYDNAFLIFMLPQSLITVSLVTALFTRMSEAAAAGDLTKVREDLSFGLRTVGIFTVFATAGLAVLALPVVRVVLPTVTLAEARSVAIVTIALLLGLTALGAWTLVQRVYYAFEDTRSLFFIQIPMALIVALGAVLGALVLDPRWWVAGAGLAMSASTITGAVTAYLRLRTRLRTLDGARVLRTHVRLGIAAGTAAVVGWGLLHIMGIGPGDDAGVSAILVSSLVRVAVVGSVMAAVYLVLLRRFGVVELDALLRPAVRLLAGPLRRVRTMTRGRGAGGGSGGDAPSSSGSGEEQPARDDGTTGAPVEPGGPDDEDPGGAMAVSEAPAQVPAVGPGTVLARRYQVTDPIPTDLPDADAWLGHDLVLDRPIQALVLEGDRTQDALDAARRAAIVDDTRLARVLGVGRHGPAAFVVTEVVGGPSLADLLTAGPLPPDQARALIGEAASALESARRRGVHHLALRPAAVHLTDDGQVLITGLGVDAVQGGHAGGDFWSASRADAVALVELLYLALTGVAPTDLAPTAPALVRSDVPADLDALCVVTLTHRDGSGGPRGSGPHSPAELIRALAPWGDLALPISTSSTSAAPTGGTGDDDPGHASRPTTHPGRRPRVVGLGRAIPALRIVRGDGSPQPTTPDPVGFAEDADDDHPVVAWTPLHEAPSVPSPESTMDERPALATGSPAAASSLEAALLATTAWSPHPPAPVDDDARPPFDAVLTSSSPPPAGALASLAAPAVQPQHMRTGADQGNGTAAKAVTGLLAGWVAASVAGMRRGIAATVPAVHAARAGLARALRTSSRALRAFGHAVATGAAVFLASPSQDDGHESSDSSADPHASSTTGMFDPTPYVMAIMLALVVFGFMWAVGILIGAANSATGSAATVVGTTAAVPYREAGAVVLPGTDIT